MDQVQFKNYNLFLAPMNTDIKSFVLLKYPMITSDKSTWDRLKTYPESVKKKWILRCARDVEHLDKTGKSKRCNDLNERYINGEIEVLVELKKAANDARTAYSAYSAYSAYTAYGSAYSAAVADATAYNAAYYAAYHAANNREEKWKLYIDWLIEELCEYEENNNEQ